MVGKSDQQEVPDDEDEDDLNHSSAVSSTDELRSADAYDHRLLARKTRPV